MSLNLPRRRFLQTSAAAAAGLWLTPTPLRGARRKVSANEKLNLGVIGVAGRGGDNLKEVASETIVALCDVDENNLAAAAKRFPGAQTYHDLRRLLDRKDLDAVVISTPDHTHAVAAVQALQAGCHVYCEKPLTRTLSECRRVTDLARRQKRVTQLGSQIHAGSNYRRVVELIQSDVIGPVREVHVWVDSSYGNRKRPTDNPAVPAHLHYDLWLGPVEYQPYHPDYIPFHWRHWWAFGGGSLADFGCHYMDLPFWALDLRYPLTIEPLDGPAVDPDSTPHWLIVRFEFPARDGKPPVRLTWYHGGKQPALLSSELAGKWKSGVLFLGEKGRLLADYGKRLLLPEEAFAEFKPPAPFVKDSIGHHKEWIEACKTGALTTCNFDYSGPLTETALLGNVAFRVGQKLEWDVNRLQAKNCPAAEQFIRHRYRKGWKI